MQFRKVVIIAVLGLLCTQAAFGTTSTWQGIGANGDWTTGANWVGGAAPAANSGNDIQFVAGSYAGTQNTVTLKAPTYVGLVNFTVDCPDAFTITGVAANKLFLGGASMTSAAQGSLRTYNITGAAPLLLTTTNAPYTFDVGANTAIVIATTGGWNNLAATGTTVMTKASAGSLVFNGPMKSGTVLVNAGALTLNAACTVVDLVTDPSATTTIGGLGTLNLSGTLSGPLTLVDGSKLVSTSAKSINTNLTASGTTVISSAAAAIFNGTLQLSGSAGFNSTAGNPVFNGNITLDQMANLNMSAGTPVWGATTNVTLNGSSTATLRAGTMAGTITVAPKANLNIGLGTYNGAWTLNDGSMTSIAAGTINVGGSLAITGTSVIRATIIDNTTINADVSVGPSAMFTADKIGTAAKGLTFAGGMSGPLTLVDGTKVTFSTTVGKTVSSPLTASGTTSLIASGTVDFTGAVSLGGTASFSATSNAIFDNTITLSNTSSFSTSSVNAKVTFNNPITLNDFASLSMATANPTWGAGSSVTLNGSSTATLRGAGTCPASITVTPGATLTIASGNFTGGFTGLGSGQLLTMTGGGIFAPLTVSNTFVLNIAGGSTQSAVGSLGNVSADMNVTGTVRAKITGDLALSGNADVHLDKNSSVNGLLSMSDNARLTMYGGWNFAASFKGSVVMSGNASLVGIPGFDVGMNTTNSFTMSGDSTAVTAATFYKTTVTLNDSAYGVFTETDWPATGDHTANGHSTLIVTGGNDTGMVFSSTVYANDYSTVKVGSDQVDSRFVVGPNASLAITHGWVSSDINGIPDSQLTLGGGYDPQCTMLDPSKFVSYLHQVNSSLVLTNTINISGSKTLNIPNWSLPFTASATNSAGNVVFAFNDPVVYVNQLSGSGDIIKAGGANSGLAFTSTTYSWAGNVVVQSGYVKISGTNTPNVTPTTPWTSLSAAVPDTLTEFVLSTANGKLLSSATTATLTGHTISGFGSVVLDNDITGTGVYALTSAGGTWKPGTASVVGSLSVLGDLAFAMNDATAAQLTIKATGGASGAFDSLLVSGAAGHGNLTGLENANLVLNIARSGWHSYIGAEMPIVTAANDLSGESFASVTWQNHMIGQVNYKNGAVTLTHVGLEGDGNNDGAIDATDYANWFNNVGGAVAGWGPGDFNGDAAVDASDYALWFNNVGASAGSPVGAVPEPATMTLLVLGGLAMLRRRK